MSRFARTILSAVLFTGVAGMTCSLVFADDGTPAPKVDASATSNDHVSGRKALDRPMPSVRFNGTSFSDVIDFISDTTDANFNVDWKALDSAHVEKDTPITLRLGAGVPLHKVLDMVFQQAAGNGVLTDYVDEGVIEITTQEASDKVLISRVYPIQDLLFEPTDYNNAPDLSLENASQGQTAGGGAGGGGAQQSQSLFQNSTGLNSGGNNKDTTQKERADEIIKLITDTVKPELWQVNGGTATISFFRGNLIVNAPRSIHALLETDY